jgi:hypothetical protein
VAVASALVAARDYRVPILVSLASAVLYAWLVYPFWIEKKRKAFVLIASVPVALLAGHAVFRLLRLL